ncbi:unnamed protein product [Mesocestoides corti]|uniref:Zinc finger, C2H2 type n=1 Tax=Mesocestoides corti TaxID=53468 RepID=A0A0R3UJI4_MESCO|nr:unnamed protein product [Mesocestoides corti]
MLTHPQISDGSRPFNLDQVIKAAAAAAVAASNSTEASHAPVSSPLPPTRCSISTIQVPMLNNHLVEQPPQLPLGFPPEVALFQKPPTEAAAIISALLNSNARALPTPVPPRLDTFGPLLSLSIRQAIADCLSNVSKSGLNIRGSLTISTPDQNSLTVSFTDGAAQPVQKANSTATPSKRKAYQPVKHFNSTPSPTASSCSPTVNTQHLSGSTSPSTTDSGALDLSRAGSFAGSAPITPMKAEALSVPQNVSFTPFPLVPSRSNIFELYQRQFPMLDSAPTMLAFTHFHGDQAAASPAKRRRVCPSTVRRSNASRRFPCNQCKEEFGSLHSLEDHTAAVHGGHRCHICQAQFTQRSNLQRHALKHVGFKPFECKVCAKSYYRKDHLMRHMEMGHPGFSPRDNIIVHLTSSESLDFLTRNSIEGNITGQLEEGIKNEQDTTVKLEADDEDHVEVALNETCPVKKEETSTSPESSSTIVEDTSSPMDQEPSMEAEQKPLAAA